VVHLGEVVAGLEAKSVGLRILYVGLDATTATGKLMLNVLVSVAQFEREMMLERQCDSIAKAKAQGKYKGRKPTAQAKKAEVVAMLVEGRSKSDVARALGISERSVYGLS
jgi:DNA invertase Pin-like site-specific DNA recombinase